MPTEYAQTPEDPGSGGVNTGRPGAERNTSLLDIIVIIAKHKRMIIAAALATAILTAVIALVIPNRYRAVASLMPPQQPQSLATALVNQLGGSVLGSMAGSNLGLKNPNDIYVALLKSRVVADGLIKRFDLRRVYRQKTEVDTRKRLGDATVISGSRDGLISISVEDKDRNRAADMANAYVAELQTLMANLVITEAGQRRLFFERQIVKGKNDLATAEFALKQTQQDTGLIQVDSQARAIVETVASLKAQIAAKEIEIQALQSGATNQNPTVVLLREQLSGMRAQLSKLETRPNAGAGDIQVPTRDVPRAELEYIRRLRDVKYAETIFELLAKQFEAAKLDEAREGAAIQVVDIAVPPDKKSFPPRTLMVLGFSVLATFFSIAYASALEWVARMESDPVTKEQLATVKRLLRVRKAQL
jgi:tyrosine-protein kinase Etk/Wzc